MNNLKLKKKNKSIISFNKYKLKISNKFNKLIYKKKTIHFNITIIKTKINFKINSQNNLKKYQTTTNKDKKE